MSGAFYGTDFVRRVAVEWIHDEGGYALSTPADIVNCLNALRVRSSQILEAQRLDGSIYRWRVGSLNVTDLG